MMKRLFFDIETSPNIGTFWQSGYKISIPPENILVERAIICICYKWEGSPKIYSLVWDNGDDKQVLIDFAKVAAEADEIVGHNIDRFDLTWVSTRNLMHDLPPVPQYKTADTLKMVRRHFRFNSNKLDYIASKLLKEKKIETTYGLWMDVAIKKKPAALKKMVKYCKKDVDLTERVWSCVTIYDTQKTHAGVFAGLPRWTCASCASDDVIVSKTKVTPKGIVQKQMLCKKCGHYYTIAANVWKDYVLEKTGEMA